MAIITEAERKAYDEARIRITQERERIEAERRKLEEAQRLAQEIQLRRFSQQELRNLTPMQREEAYRQSLQQKQQALNQIQSQRQEFESQIKPIEKNLASSTRDLDAFQESIRRYEESRGKIRERYAITGIKVLPPQFQQGQMLQQKSSENWLSDILPVYSRGEKPVSSLFEGTTIYGKGDKYIPFVSPAIKTFKTGTDFLAGETAIQKEFEVKLKGLKEGIREKTGIKPIGKTTKTPSADTFTLFRPQGQKLPYNVDLSDEDVLTGKKFAPTAPLTYVGARISETSLFQSQYSKISDSPVIQLLESSGTSKSLVEISTIAQGLGFFDIAISSGATGKTKKGTKQKATIREIKEKREKAKVDTEEVILNLNLKREGNVIRDKTMSEKVSDVRALMNKIKQTKDPALKESQINQLKTLLDEAYGKQGAKEVLSEYARQEGIQPTKIKKKKPKTEEETYYETPAQMTGVSQIMTSASIPPVESSTILRAPSKVLTLQNQPQPSIEFLKQPQLQLFGQATQQEQLQKQLQQLKQPSLSLLGLATLQSQAQRQPQKEIQIQPPILIQPPITTQIQPPVLRQPTPPRLREPQPPIKRLRKPREPRRPFRPLIPTPAKSLLKKLARREKEQGFEAFGRRFGKDFSLGISKTKSEASKKLKEWAEETLGASGYIIKGKQKIMASDVLGMGDIRFRPSKTDPFRIVEKRQYRLSRPSEVREISFFRKKKKTKKFRWF